MASNSFGNQRPRRPHILRGGGRGREIDDLRKDVDAAFITVEAAIAGAGAPAIPTVLNFTKAASPGGDGSPAAPFDNIGDAMTAAAALTPSASNRVVVRGFDAETYEENVPVPAFVNLEAPNATIKGVAGGTDNAVTLLNDSVVRVFEIIQESASGVAAVCREDSVGASYLYADRLTLGGANGATGILSAALTNNTVLISKVGTIYVGSSGGGRGISASPSGHLHFEVEDIYLAADSSIGIDRLVAGQTVGSVTHILEIGVPTGCKGIRVNGGEVNVITTRIDVTTTYDVPLGGELNMFAAKLVGTPSVGGTVNVSTP